MSFKTQWTLFTFLGFSEEYSSDSRVDDKSKFIFPFAPKAK